MEEDSWNGVTALVDPSRRALYDYVRRAGHPVSRLVRTDVGPIRLGNQRPGTTRDLTTREIGELYAAVGL